MSFRISKVGKNGAREASVLVECNKGSISSDASSSLQCNIPEGHSLTINFNGNLLTVAPTGGNLTIDGKELSGPSESRTSLEFFFGNSHFYITKVIEDKICKRKKTYLSSFALTIIWVLLAIMIIVPAWLPYKIRVHDTRDRNVLVDTCSKGLDDLRHFLRDEMGKIDNYSQIHRDIVTTLNEEVENMAWAFRHGGDFMSSDQMSKLQEDISKYKETVKKLRKTKAVSVTPLDANQVINSVLAPK